MKYTYWIFANIYGYIFGWRYLAPFHHVLANLSLHSLGYDNLYFTSWSGEEWFLKKIISPTNPKICFDVGANVGNYTEMILKFTDARIFAFEPSSSSFEKLKTISNSRVTASNVAVADFDGDSFIYSRADRDEKASLDKNVNSGGKKEHVSVITINSFVKNNSINEIDYLKIDTEGYEREVLTGLRGIRPKFVQFEFNGHHMYRNCTLLELTKLLSGYTFYRLLPHGMIKINPKKVLDAIFMFSNIVAIREDVKLIKF